MVINLLLEFIETYSQKTQEILIGNQTLQSRTKQIKQVYKRYTNYTNNAYKCSCDTMQRLNFLNGCWVKP